MGKGLAGPHLLVLCGQAPAAGPPASAPCPPVTCPRPAGPHALLRADCQAGGPPRCSSCGRLNPQPPYYSGNDSAARASAEAAVLAWLDSPANKTGVDPATGTCVPCDVPQCTNCASNATSCTTCAPRFYLDEAGGGCVPVSALGAGRRCLRPRGPCHPALATLFHHHAQCSDPHCTACFIAADSTHAYDFMPEDERPPGLEGSPGGETCNRCEPGWEPEPMGAGCKPADEAGAPAPAPAAPRQAAAVV